ncbi:MAG: hypothetical protein JNL58_25815 [Planctomyces sp.]|nr:hypothetical protein [Planctomyces sp.]
MTIPNAGLSKTDGAMQNHFSRIFLLAMVVCLTATTEVRAEVTLEQLRRMAIEWRQSFKSLRVTSEWKSLPDSEGLLMDLPNPEERGAALVWMKLDWTWSEVGFERLELIRYSPKDVKASADTNGNSADTNANSADTNGNSADTNANAAVDDVNTNVQRGSLSSLVEVVPWMRDLDVYNGPGKFFFSAQYRMLDDSNELLDQLRIVGVFEGVPPAQNLTELIPGIFEPHSRLWLSDQLSPYHPTNIPVRPPGASNEYSAQRYWKYSGTEVLLGSPCAKLIHADQPTGPDSHSTATRTLWLDIEHNGLPRRILTEYVREDESTTGIDFVVDEFQQLNNGIWFPRVARRRLPSRETMLCVYTSVGLNVALNELDFQPPQPQAKTRVTDTLGLTLGISSHVTTDFADAAGRSTTTGPHVESFSHDRKESGSDTSNPGGGNTLRIVIGLLCSLLLAGFVLWRMRSARG